MGYSSKLDAIYFKDLAAIKNKTYDYIVVGGGAYGSSFVHRILELNPAAKILVLEKGSILIPTHYQNLPRAYQNIFNYTEVQPWKVVPDTYQVHGQIPYFGGRALYWNAWVPKPTAAQMQDWPKDVIEGLEQEWEAVDKLIGRSTTIDINGHTGDLHKVMRQRLFENLGKIAGCDHYESADQLDGPMATLGNHSDKAWQRFAPVHLLINAINKYPGNIDVVANCEVTGLRRNGTGISHIEVDGEQIAVNKAKLILALGVIEAVTLVKPAFPENKLLGRNFIGHFRSQVFTRVPRAAAGVHDDRLQLAALYQSGVAVDREYHMHVCCIYNPKGKEQEADLFRVTPYPAYMDAFMDPAYLYIELHAMAEIKGERTAESANHITVEGGETTIHFTLADKEGELWDKVDKMVLQIAGIMADGHKIEYLQGDFKSWSFKAPEMKYARDLSLVHESGVMWMGNSAQDSVTDSWGKMHEADNMYVLGGATFPTCGSWNPTYTGIAMTYRLARRFSKEG